MAFDEAAGCGAFVWRACRALSLGGLGGALVLDVDDGEPDEFDDGVVGGELSTILDDLADLVVEALDRVGCVDDLPDLGWEGQERGEAFPGSFPQTAIVGLVFAAQGGLSVSSNRAASAASTVGAV